MEFLFVDSNTSTDRRSQRLIRSHGMKGKNAGKVIPARGHRWRREDGQPPSYTDGERVRAMQAASPANPFCGFEFSYFSTSVPVTASSRQLFHDLHNAVSEELYPRAFCRQSNEIGTRWFETVMTNPCLFHCGLAVMGIHRYQLLGRRDEPLDSTHHLLQAMRLLRRDLNAVSTTQETSVIAVVISLAMHANFADAVAESRTHLQALKRIVQLRPGGLVALCAAVPELGNKIRRTDAELALRSGTPTIFGSRHLSLPAPLHHVSLGDRWQPIALPFPLQDVCIELQPAIRDILMLCSYAGRSQLGTVQYQDLVISIVQRLVDYAPLDGARPPRPLDDICQLGFLSFMTTVVHREPPSKHPELNLWLHFIYAMSASDDSAPFRRVDLPTADRIRVLGEALAIRTWEVAVAHLRVYPWVEAFHDEMGRDIWEQTTCRWQD
ncbi:hypothetical protein SPBR_04198 [Sporothrix brasiliensis 5110]|uniref:Uncharacterized protein n=1 Tax=Sporothrix brasiliensis 5110 TaxID=1398154 RepID=A0A0C2J3I7_9PEZI|nr:uncharacterized protein SPBR_04198 [Sporothrix brasiliensis 5110]KIH93590.1 hypothetical protein SPBR_04198 [Sporothrix brasiliensis 5110]